MAKPSIHKGLVNRKDVENARRIKDQALERAQYLSLARVLVDQGKLTCDQVVESMGDPLSEPGDASLLPLQGPYEFRYIGIDPQISQLLQTILCLACSSQANELRMYPMQDGGMSMRYRTDLGWNELDALPQNLVPRFVSTIRWFLDPEPNAKVLWARYLDRPADIEVRLDEGGIVQMHFSYPDAFVSDV